MGKPFTQIYLHLVWATWDRLPLISPAIENRLYTCLREKIRQLDCETLALGGIEDHVHLLIRTPPTLCASGIVKQLKGNSSHLISQIESARGGFKWQGYYGAFSVSRGDLERVENYINNQKERHARGRLWDNAEQTQYSE